MLPRKTLFMLGALAALSLLIVAALPYPQIALSDSSPYPLTQNTNNFHAHLNGEAEVPPVDTNAQGQALFKFSKDGSTLYYKLIVANIEDVFAAHIHCGFAGENGPIGVTLFSSSTPLASPEGVIAEATVNEPDPGNACGWYTLADVEAAIRSGNAYVNVHTTAHPSGEIRSQIR